MAEILFGIAAEILKTLASQAVEEVRSVCGVDAELHKLSHTVSSIQAVLLDAGEKQSSSPQVKDWISRLKPVFLEANDLLDDVATEVAHQKFDDLATDVARRKLVMKKVRTFFSKSNPLLYRLRISNHLKAIRQNLDAIAKDMASLNLVASLVAGQQPLVQGLSLDRETYSSVPDELVIGRSDDKKIIIDFLLDSDVHGNVEVVSVVGIGGLGKTTLARSVFNDEIVQRNFDKSMWVCVSDVFDVKLIAEKAIESATKEKPNYLQLDEVQKKLQETLGGKKYLLVLDDVWSEDHLKWSTLKDILTGGAKGSKILVTTRSDKVADASGAVHRHKLGDLPEEEAWELFRKMAFESNTERENEDLVEIGKEIVKKCAGVPLAIRSVGALLRFKNEDEWIRLKNQDLSSITRDDNVMPILRSSYNRLPQHLKVCFAYCSLFPKDFKISRVDLVDMWIAQGFIQSTSSGSRDMEDDANSYFMDLLRRSFFQEANEQTCKMHDLIHDLANEVADREFFSITKDTEIVPEQTLHASSLIEIVDSLPFHSTFYGNHKKLRTLIKLGGDYDRMSDSTLERMISSFKCLRVLYLHRDDINFLPQCLGGLKHLRYLAITSLSIVKLPNSITKLHNLQVLKLNGCSELKELPRDIWRLVCLRRLECQSCLLLTHIPRGLWQLASLVHLDFDGCDLLEEMPPGIGQLTCLRTLTRFVVGKESCISGLASDRLNELKGLVNLRGRLSIKFKGQVHERMPIGVVKRMKHLRSVSVEFESGGGAELIMLEALQPHQNVESLEIKYYGGSRFPSWLMDENLGLLLPKLVKLSITGINQKCEELPSLWQLPCLQNLILWNVDSVVEASTAAPSDKCYFPSLKRLDLQSISEKIMKQILCPSPLCNLNELRLHSVEGLETMAEDVFRNLTSLQSLEIRQCYNLVSLSLTSLESLCVWVCPLLDLSKEEEAFPGNLSAFEVWGLPKLTTLPIWLRHVSATLKSIVIWECHNLTTIPEWIGNLKALTKLQFTGCHNLTSLPEGMRSLTALQILSIRGCSSILKQRCEEETGEDWPIIAHIPTVDISKSWF